MIWPCNHPSCCLLCFSNSSSSLLSQYMVILAWPSSATQLSKVKPEHLMTAEKQYVPLLPSLPLFPLSSIHYLMDSASMVTNIWPCHSAQLPPPLLILPPGLVSLFFCASHISVVCVFDTAQLLTGLFKLRILLQSLTTNHL